MTRALRLLLVTLVAVAAVVLQPAGASAAERTVTYTVSTRGAVSGDLGHFTDVARDALTDPRGWSLGGTVAFQQVASGSDFDLVLAAPSVIAAASPGCSAQWSCRVGRSVYINDERWRLGTASWPHGIDTYQRYVINHEVGHWVGIGHTDCPSAGRTAWVMQQQSISLQGCHANVWPVIAEREQAGRLLGVSVAWSAVEQRYRALGQEGGILGAPVDWERRSPDGVGAYQNFARPATIYASPATGAHEIYGAIRGHYGALGYELGLLGYPTTGERGSPDGVGRYQNFARPGTIYFTPATGAHEIYGAIHGHYAALSYELGPLGYPITGERGSPDGVGRYQNFSRSDGASIYFTPRTGAHEVYGPIWSRWGGTGWELGPLGYPVSGVYDAAGGSRTDFEGGYITLDAATGETEVVLE
ncbi:DUF3152 domain-containing protein [Blastococcus sp. KM273128]|uniref:DUF3152 domain-containing protein n=1 Tax=Blastococcus sp. KM273128 TaxID=2570314 RepID=UPI001F195ED0|nr:DUF3152 domain-containing protein [Blastococcus sp. KM273128]